MLDPGGDGDLCPRWSCGPEVWPCIIREPKVRVSPPCAFMAWVSLTGERLWLLGEDMVAVAVVMVVMGSSALWSGGIGRPSVSLSPA